ncbi:4Fe-4S binding protein [Candidatus Bathyarchaeota archaeon]|jgi:pyruvate ferredoxin oxidoreductase delta subunit|nr:4Fe-4S binding protein [Candidatus Bathyarchaeota archaeon]
MSEKSLGEKMRLPWSQMPIGGVMTVPGASTEYKTGDWRIQLKPVINHEKCVMCLLCWIFCPDVSIYRTEKTVEVDYYHCKGCGVCSNECPTKAIDMVKE